MHRGSILLFREISAFRYSMPRMLLGRFRIFSNLSLSQSGREASSAVVLAEGKDSREIVVCDYISGMTDQYAIYKFEEFYVPKAWNA